MERLSQISRRVLNAITNVLIRGRQKEISYSQKRKRHTRKGGVKMEAERGKTQILP